MPDRDGFIDAVLGTVKGIADRLSARIDALERREMPPGRDGVPGRDGLPGAVGERGLTGEKGLDGQPGKHGERGESPYEIAVRHGFVGDEMAWLASLVGATGAQGRDGEKGERGEKGDTVVGPLGPQGERGEKGIDGITLRIGDIQPPEYDGRRTLTWVFQKEGHEARHSIKLPIPIWEETYSEGKQYEAHDIVTWGGGGWKAIVDTTAKPGLGTTESRAWKLVVKPGRDGKEGKPGPEGKSGPMGPKGDRGPEKW